MDPSAYMPREQWLQMLKEMGLEEVALRDHRYDCVVHLVTAAKGAESFYTLDNNSTRTEGLDLAARLDTAVMNAWVGHANFVVIDNESVANFHEKCDRVVQTVSSRLGLTNPICSRQVIKKKYLVKEFDLYKPFPVPYREFLVEHRYLINTTQQTGGTQTRIRRREELGTSTVHLTMTMRYPEVDGQRVETRRNLPFREYEMFKSQSDPTRQPIHKIRRCFLYKDRYFQIDVFKSASPGLVLLEGYLDPNHCVLPDWLELEDVTDDKSYSMFNLAHSKP